VRALKRTVRDLERLARHHAAAAERARLEARDAALEARLGGGAALLVPVAEWMLGLLSGRWSCTGEGLGGGLRSVGSVRELLLRRERLLYSRRGNG
jgi:hypothetical protein